ncbi:uncharacterized protein Nmag_1381 [Natrialba magadii ATCC 43099]|uniref:Transmembrane glycoprotein / HTH domain protein n=1 Tax=Natrialba magadii (strain ATCC 43099 / DSM 3394 / CCM 3739 / CIP 104546 / IAM 13178 / JCM 8861 / NBRC 102185 / NCIMB 2190 / MS3) TaxID=547559 RepID=D3ST14_NATMM|nr:hypothetical protein [Natrialba magadii]ADD04960.1 uncharacterized protein Nmag_1381 [Natrialba magadii ATCC 43099]ELY24008.1 hypothetical protein C500_19430 [Natrialba magadii ATCC 43099]
MRLSTAVTLTLVALLVTAAFGPVAATPTAAAGNPASAPSAEYETALEQPAAFSQSSVDPSYGQPAEIEHITRITVNDNGDAHWSLEYRFVLDDADEIDAFNDYAAAVVANERGVETPIQDVRQQVTYADANTDREMSIVGAGWDSYETRSYDDDIETENDPEGTHDGTEIGVITYTFTWTNFADTDGDRIYLGDALQVDGSDRPAISVLHDGQRLVIESPSNYGLQTPTQLTWNGYHEFSDDEFEIVFLRGAEPPSDFSWLSLPLTLGAVALTLALAFVGLAAYRYSRDDPLPGEPQIAALLGTDAAENASADATEQSKPTPSSQGRPATHSPEPESVPATSNAGDDGTQLEFTEPADEDIDPELLSDEERVQRMLAGNGGRMKQAAIVSETGWSNAKVSQLLSQMDEDGQIEKLRIGRENLITLPEVDPTEID